MGFGTQQMNDLQKGEVCRVARQESDAAAEYWAKLTDEGDVCQVMFVSDGWTMVNEIGNSLKPIFSRIAPDTEVYIAKGGRLPLLQLARARGYLMELA